MKLDVKVASVDALDAVKSRPSRICPLICDYGFRADGDRCVKITCRAGYELSEEGGCEKVAEKKPRIKRDKPRVLDTGLAAPVRARDQKSNAQFVPLYNENCRFKHSCY